MHQTDELITTAQVAEVANRDRTTITRWVLAGKLEPALRTPGGALLFSRSEVDRFLAEREATS